MLILEFELIEDEDERMQCVTALQSSEEGKKKYEDLCEKKIKFREMVSTCAL